MMLALLVACGAPEGSKGPTDRANDSAGRDSAFVDDTGDGPGADSGDDSGAGSALDALLAALRADRDGTLLAVSRDSGWPAPVEGGWLFVQTARGDDWHLAGDLDGWVGQPMARDDGFSWIVHPASPGDAYKFTDGAAWDPDPWARAYAYDDFGEKSLVAPTTAHLERQLAVEGEGLLPRDLHLWVPEGPATHVLYVHDGQNLFDPEAPWGGWRLQDSVPDGMLVVGIANTADRMDEYTHVPDLVYGEWYGGAGDAYAALVQHTVRPLVDALYGEPPTVGLMGSSLGGLVSFHVADRHPGEYAFAASLSGTMGWGSIGADNETMIERYAAAGHRSTALYLDSGGGGDCVDADGDGLRDDDPSASDNYCENLQLRDVLADAGYTFEEDLWHWWEPDAAHDEAAWAERVWRPLAIFAAR